MRGLFPLALLALVGCSSGEAKEAAAASVAPEAGIVLSGRPTPVTGIAINWEGASARVGDTWEAAQKVFPEPRRGAYPLLTLPERFGKEFEAHGWESNSGQGYGVITRNDLVVAAIYHVENADADYALRLLGAQRAGSGELRMNEVASGSLDWNFWEDGGQRLMVLREKGQKGADVTVLMGDGGVLDALGAIRPTAKNAAVAPFLSQPTIGSESKGTPPSPKA